MSKTNYLENKLLEHSVGKTAYSMPAVWVALFTASPGEAGSTTAEIVAGSYLRVATTAADWTTAASGVLSNATALAFPLVTVAYPADVTHFGLMDAASGGNMLHYGLLDNARTANVNSVPTFQPGTLTLTED